MPKRPERGGTPKDVTTPSPPKGRPILSCRLQVRLPEILWAHRFTTEHPEVRMEVLNRLEMGEGATLLEIRLSAPEGG